MRRGRLVDEVRMMRALVLVSAAPLVVAAAATASASNFTAYRAQVNGICRSYTPKFKKLEADMAPAKRTGDVHRYAYVFGKILGMGLAQGVRVERTPVPTDGRTRMAPTLRLLHAVDVQLRRVLLAATSGDQYGFKAELTKLGKVSAP